MPRNGADRVLMALVDAEHRGHEHSDQRSQALAVPPVTNRRVRGGARRGRFGGRQWTARTSPPARRDECVARGWGQAGRRLQIVTGETPKGPAVRWRARPKTSLRGGTSAERAQKPNPSTPRRSLEDETSTRLWA
jgi:hypothetical protein